MAQYRQSGAERFAVRSHHDSHGAGEQISIRIPNKPNRIRRPGRPDKSHRRISAIAVFAVTLSLGLLVTLFAFHHLTQVKDIQSRYDKDGEKNESVFKLRLNQSIPSKELKFGHGSGMIGRDSRYWDRDDRRRDHDYDEKDVMGQNSVRNELNSKSKSGTQHKLVEKIEGKSGSGELYNEGGRTELNSYEEEYEASLKNGRQSTPNDGAEEVNPDDEYDDGIDVLDDHEDEEHDDNAVHPEDGGSLSGYHYDRTRKLDDANLGETRKDPFFNNREKASSEVSRNNDGGNKMEQRHAGSGSTKVSNSAKKSGSKRKPKRHKYSGSSCEMKFLNSTAQLVEPLENKKFSRFSLQYTEVEERPSGSENWEPRFAGHQTPQKREESFHARDQKIDCGFIKGPNGSPSTGFDLAEDDMKFMSSCHIAVSSCIFGNSDHLRTPYSKTISRQSRKNVCFVMFMDESTLQMLSSEGQKMDNMGFIGLWKIVVVKNLPFTDMRRVGKIPKFLTHRLFPSARYSIWLDSKLRLQTDPYLILEYFLWRRGYEYAISNHYDRHCVWEEVIQNKKLNKFNHTVIDQQFEFYQSDGLKRFDPSDPNKLLPSYVPEGSFIVRAHTPMSNLFSCLWFNEVDHFTPRDQLSFAYTYLKLRRMNPKKPFHLNMFKDCERRSIAKLFRHRAEDKRNVPTEEMR